MADEEGESVCLICLNEGMNLITAECGHDICMSCFTTSSCCTSCREFSQMRTLQVDIVMHPEGEGMCELHWENQKLFCDKNRTLLCVTCSKLEDHENHIHWPIAVAALRYRKKIQTRLDILCRKAKRVQDLLLKEKERPLVWAVVYNDYKHKNRKIFYKKFEQMWECLMKKTKKAKSEELIMGKENKEFSKLYQRLKELEVAEEHQIMEQKKKWEATMSSQSRFLTVIIAELEEKMKKSDVELLQDVTETLERSFVWFNLKPFIPSVDASYLHVVMEFLKFFQRHKLSERCNFYVSEEKKRAIRIVPGFSDKKYIVYIFGSIQAEDIRGRTFIT